MKEIELYNFLVLLAKRRWVIVIGTLIGLIFGLLYTNFIQQPIYESSAKLLFIDEETEGITLSDTTIIQNYIELINSRAVIETVAAKYHNIETEDLAAMTTITNRRGSDVLVVSVRANEPEHTQQLTGAVVTTFLELVQEQYDEVPIRIIDEANLPEEAINSRPVFQVVAGGVVGLVATVALLYILTLKEGMGRRSNAKKRA